MAPKRGRLYDRWMPDLRSFSLGEMVQLSPLLRHCADGAQSMEDAAQRVTRLLADAFVEPGGDRQIKLARLYRTQRFQALDPDQRAAASVDGEPDPSTLCLALLATVGEREEWNDRTRSTGHRAIQLRSQRAVEESPMIARLFHQFDASAMLEGDVSALRNRGAFSVFHVEDPAISPFVPAKDFVASYGIQSVVGFGGFLPPNDLFATVLFAACPILAETAEMFSPLGLSVKLALLDFIDGLSTRPASSKGEGENDPRPYRISTLAQLVEVQEDIAMRQTTHMEALLEHRDRQMRAVEESQAQARGSEARKEAIMQASLDAVITIDSGGVIDEWNEAAERIFGYGRSEVVGRSLVDLIIPPQHRAAHLAGMARFAETGDGPVLNQRIEISALRKDGTEFPVELAITAVHHDNDVFFSGYVRDITQQKADADRLRQLQLVTNAAFQTLALDELLPQIVRGIEGMLSPDAVGIMLLGDDGTLELAEGTGLEVRDDEPFRMEIGVGVVGRIALSAQPLIIEDVSTIPNVSYVITQSGIRSAMGVPLLAQDTLLGVLFVGSHRTRAFTKEEAELLGLVAARISLGIEHARSYERERQIAQTLQMSLLPDRLTRSPSLDIAVRYVPAVEGSHAGGDWYDVIPLPDGRVGLGIGDVMGHGIAAAAIMGQIRHAVRAYAFEGTAPHVVLERLNHLIIHTDVAEMATMLYAVYDPRTGELTYSSAGHPPPLLVDALGTRTFLDAPGAPPIGVAADVVYTLAHATLQPGDSLLLYTDGLIEVRGEDLGKGMDRLAGAIPAEIDDAESVASAIARVLLPHGGGGDDAAYMVVRPAYVAEGPFRLEIKAQPTNLAQMRAAMEGWLRTCGASDEETFELLVAVNEAASNAIEHAYGPSDAVIVIEADCRDGAVDISVCDFGRWKIPRPSRGGRGIGMMEAFADKVRVAPGRAGTKVHLHRRLAAGAVS